MNRPKLGVRRIAAWTFYAFIAAAFTVGGRGNLSAQPNAAGTAIGANGDPLPAGALARLGTLRWRHGETVSFVAFLPDGTAVLTGSADRTLRLWDRVTGKEIRRFTLPPVAPLAMGAGQVAVRRFPFANLGQLVAALSKDGNTLATAGNDNDVQLWDVATGKEIRKIKGPANGVTGLLFTPDSKAIAIRGADRSTALMSVATGARVVELKRNQQQPGVRVAIPFGLDSTGMAFSADGKRIATVEMEVEQNQVKNFVRISDATNGDDLRHIEVMGNGTSALAFAPNGEILAFALNADIHLHNPADGAEIRKIAAPTGAATMLFTSDSKTLIARTRDQAVQLWDAESGKELRRLGEGMGNPAGLNIVAVRFAGLGEGNNLAVSADGKTVATGAGNTIRMWDIATGKEEPLAGGHRGPISALGVSRDGKLLVSRGSDNVIRCWDLAEGREVRQFHEPAGTLTVAFAPDGHTLAFGGADGAIRLVDPATGKPVTQFKGHAGGTGALVYSPDGKQLASIGATSNAILIHDAAKGDVRRQIVLQAPNPGGARQVIIRGAINQTGGPTFAFSPDGKMLIGHFPVNTNAMILNNPGGAPQAAPNAQIRLWDVAGGKELRKITLPAQRGVGSISLSPDGRILASENGDGTISLWELASGQERSHLGKPEVAQAPAAPQAMFGAAFVALNAGIRPRADGSTVAFSPDGSLVAFKGPARSIRVWDVAANQEIGSFAGHDGNITALTFTPDGRRLATGSADTTVLVWNVAGLPRPSSPPTRQLSAKELTALWDELRGDDARKAYVAIRWMIEGSDQAVPFLREHAKPAVPPDSKKLDRLIAQLDSDDFEERNGATDELARLGELAIPALQKLAASQATLEARRRVEALLLRLTGGNLSPDQVRTVRVVEVLERTATPPARELLAALAKGAPGALATREAQAALDRLGRP